jgi:hypothetical protein
MNYKNENNDYKQTKLLLCAAFFLANENAVAQEIRFKTLAEIRVAPDGNYILRGFLECLKRFEAFLPSDLSAQNVLRAEITLNPFETTGCFCCRKYNPAKGTISFNNLENMDQTEFSDLCGKVKFVAYPSVQDPNALGNPVLMNLNSFVKNYFKVGENNKIVFDLDKLAANNGDYGVFLNGTVVVNDCNKNDNNDLGYFGQAEKPSVDTLNGFREFVKNRDWTPILKVFNNG